MTTKLATTRTKRTGTLEPAMDVGARVYYRGKIRLRVGSRVRIEIAEPKCYLRAPRS